MTNRSEYQRRYYEQVIRPKRLTPPAEKTCAQCGQAMTGTARRRYCSGACRLAAHRASKAST